jgi:hypothetical protein
MTAQEQRMIYEKIENIKDELKSEIADLKDYVHKNNHIKEWVDKNAEEINCNSKNINEVAMLLKEHLVECKTKDSQRMSGFNRAIVIVTTLVSVCSLGVAVISFVV